MMREALLMVFANPCDFSVNAEIYTPKFSFKKTTEVVGAC